MGISTRKVSGISIKDYWGILKPLLAILALTLAACGRGVPTGVPVTLDPTLAGYQPPEPTFTPLQPILPSPTSAVPSPTPENQAALSLWVSPDVPETLAAALSLPAAFEQTASREGATLHIVVGDQHRLSQWNYTLVAPFPTLADEVSAAELQGAWQGELSTTFQGAPLLMDEDTHAALSAWWGPPSAGAVKVLPAGDLAATAWENRPSWAVVPFESLGPEWKVLEVRGASPIRRDFDPDRYPLSVPVSLEGDPTVVSAIATLYGLGSANPMLPATNRDPEKLTLLVMTGVTALVRSTAWTMERQGMTYPARDIGPWLRGADITHISNEVPFAYDCPYPNPVQEDLRFCSDPRYIELLDDVGTDVVELTGDHFSDWGPQAMLDTLDLYRERGWQYYGGGENFEVARRPITLENNGNRLAFIGCNGKGGWYAGATASHPGTVSCDFEYMASEITRLRGEGYLPIATFQHYEYYTFSAPPNQVADFRRLAQAGAVIVSGSQAHHPQVLEFYDGAFIHYGLGNLFFDQIYVSRETARAFIDRHVIYAGRHISTELLTIQFEDYARSRPMMPEEREAFLQIVFSASGW